MTRGALFVIRLLTPSVDREWVVGDIVEEFNRIERDESRAAAARWLRTEMWRVAAGSVRHRLAAPAAPHTDVRPSRRDGIMKSIGQDFRYAIRLLRKAPGFTVVAVLTLGLGIGANAAMFAVVNAVLLKPLPFTDADRLMLVHMVVPDRNNPGVYSEVVWSYPKYIALTQAQQVFEAIGFFSPRDADIAGDGEPERLRSEVVNDTYTAVLGVTPLLGRPFSHDEANTPGSPPAAMISHGLWSRRFGGVSTILGRELRVNGVSHAIVGVLPRGFRGLSGMADIWLPVAAVEPSQLEASNAWSHSYYVVARRKRNVSEQAAAAATRVAGAQVDAAYRDPSPRSAPWGASAVSLYSSRADVDVRRASFVLLGAVGFVLLIACLNLTNVVATKGLARRREVAVRVAIGASRGRIVRQFLAEGVVLAAIDAAAGLAVAGALLKAAAVLLPDADVFFRTAVAPGTPRTAGASGLTRIGAAMIGVDGATVLFVCAVAVVTAMLVSLLPAIQASVLRPIDALKIGAAAVSRRARSLDARAALVMTQIALALVLLAGAGLMFRSAGQLRATEIGLNPDRITTLRLDLPRAAYPPSRGYAFFDQIVQRVRTVPGVESIGLGSCPPVSGGCNGTIMWFPPAPPRRNGMDPLVGIHWVSPDYFSTLGIRLLSGRLFEDRDRADQPKVLLVNEAAARAIWPNESPIGKIVAVGQGGVNGAAVVGVVSNVRYRNIETVSTPDVYVPIQQSYQTRMRMFVRSGLDTRTLIAAISREVKALDPDLPLSEIKSMNDRIGDAMWRTRVSAWLLSMFATLALLLTAVGIFGVMAQAVAQRTAEIGIRMALGAEPRDVLALVLRRAAAVTAAGLTVGLAGALALTRLIAAFLYGVKANDPTTFVGVALLLGTVALLASYLPARRATRVDAMAALRSE